MNEVNKFRYNKIISIIIFIGLFSLVHKVNSQPIPSEEENIDFLLTYSDDANKLNDQNDNIQIFFVAIPKNYQGEIYIELFDADIGGKYDILNGSSFNSKTKFAIYGGAGAYSNANARTIEPKGNYKSGKHLSSNIFGNVQLYDDQWYSFGKFEKTDGEYIDALNSYIFKIIVEGLGGDDGNMYRFYVSSSYFEFKPIEGSNCIFYRKSFSLKNEKNHLAHVFPYVDKNVKSLTQYNYDFNMNAYIRLNTRTKKSHKLEVSGDKNWKSSSHQITSEEADKFVDILFISTANISNDIMFYVLDQSKNPIPMYTIPLGGIPKYEYKINVVYKYMLD